MANGAKLVPGVIQSVSNAATWAANTSTGAVTISQPVTARVAANDLALTASRTIPFGSVLGAAARALPYISAGLLAYQVYDAVRCKKLGDGTATGLLCDPGTAPVQVKVWCSGGQCGDPLAIAVSKANQEFSSPTYAGWRPTPQPGECVAPSSGTAFTCTITILTQYGTNGSRSYDFVAQVGTQCPPMTQGGASPAAGADGKCPTGAYQPKTFDQAEAIAQPYVSPSSAAQIAKDAAPYVDLAPYASPLSVTGPAAVAGSPVTSTVTPPATAANPNPAPLTTTTQPVYNIHYDGDSYSYSTVTTATAPDGTTTTSTGPNPDAEVCGVAGHAACSVKVDEQGTPAYSPTTDNTPATLPQTDAAKRDAAMQSVTPPDFGFVDAPPIAECSPVAFPNNMGSLNPCGVVSDVRAVMAYLWALAAVWLALGWIRETVSA